MRKNLILGGTGFIGANLASILFVEPSEDVLLYDNCQIGQNHIWLKDKFEVIEADILNFELLRQTILDYRPDRIFHLAANSDIQNSSSNPKIDIQNTLMTTVSLSQVLNQYKANEVIFASSSAVYGDKEGSIKESETCRPLSSYGWMKLASEAVLIEDTKNNKIRKLLISRFPNVTGQWQTHGVVYDLVKKLKKSPQLLEVLGNGSQQKPYALASELCTNILKVMELEWNGHLTLNFAPSTSTLVREIAELIIEKSGSAAKLKFGSELAGWVGDVPKYELDCQKLHALRSDIKFSSSNSAIAKSIEFALDEIQV